MQLYEIISSGDLSSLSMYFIFLDNDLYYKKNMN